MRWATIFRLITLTFLLLIACNRAVVRVPGWATPVDGRLWERLGRLQSFEFSLRYHTDLPAGIKARFSGRWQSPDLEFWDGFWERDGKKVGVRLWARDKTQLEWNGEKWQVMPRGVEATILRQMEQVLMKAEPELLKDDGGKEVYRFQPNLPLIDWTGVKRLEGRLEVDKRSGLPVRIYCTSKDRSAEWELRLMRFNRGRRVVLPFVPVKRFRVVVREGGWGCRERKRAAAIIQGRLRNMGVNFRLKSIRNGFYLTIDRDIGIQSLNLLLSPGRAELWYGRWAGDSVVGGVAVGGDVTKRVILENRIAQNGDFFTTLDVEVPREPRLRVKMKRTDAGMREGVTVLVVDDMVLGTGEMDEEGDYIFSGIGSEERVRVIAILGNSLPLPTKFEVVAD